MMDILSVDIETYSDIDLKASGVYPYAASPNFQILLIGFALNDGPVSVINMFNAHVPGHKDAELFNRFAGLMADPKTLKTAFNANFESVCLSTIEKAWGDPALWSCTAVLARYKGLPGDLAGSAKALGLDQQKDAAGKALINYFSKPCKATKANGGRERNYPNDDLEKWHRFIKYCAQDVEVEREVRNKLGFIPDDEQQLYALDQKINHAGVRVDSVLVKAAIQADSLFQKRLKKRAKDISGVSNPNSLPQLKTWLESQGMTVNGITKDTMPGLIENATSPEVVEMLEIRQHLSRTSIKKYQAMENATYRDNRVRGLFQFYGANRTGRWAGRLVQVQNLPRNYLPDLDLARQLIRDGHPDAVEMLFDSLPDTLSQLIRTALIPEEGKKFIVSDFSAIEARVIAFLAGEGWRLKVFNTHGKIYEASASAMFNVPLERIDKGSPLRQKGKVAELALGYQGSVGALITMGALDMGLTEEELPELVAVWREANPNIVRFWREVENAAYYVVNNPYTVQIVNGLTFRSTDDYLIVKLLSGRELHYYKPRIEIDSKFNRSGVTYLGSDSSKGFHRISTYGGKLVENITQAVARDCLAYAMLNVDKAGYRIVMHVHDEIVVEADQKDTVEEVNRIMKQPVSWAPELPLNADGFECTYYQKD